MKTANWNYSHFKSKLIFALFYRMTVIDLNLVISCKTRLNTVDLYDHTESIIMTGYAIVFLLLGKPQ